MISLPSISFLSNISDKEVYLTTNRLDIAFKMKLCSAKGPKIKEKIISITDPIPPIIPIRSNMLKTYLDV